MSDDTSYGPTCCVGECCGAGSYCCGHPDNQHEHDDIDVCACGQVIHLETGDPGFGEVTVWVHDKYRYGAEDHTPLPASATQGVVLS